MPELEDLLVDPWTRAALVHEDTDELPEPTMDAISRRTSREMELFRRSIPAYVAAGSISADTRKREYNPARCLFNERSEDLLRMRRDLAIGIAGINPVTLATFGDSKAAAWGAQFGNSIAAVLRESLAATDGMIFAGLALAARAEDTRWTVTGFTATGANLHLNARANGTSTAALQLNRRSNGFRVIWRKTGTATHTVSVNGGTPVNLTPDGTIIPPGLSVGYYYMDLVGLPTSSTHRIEVSVTTASGGTFELLGFRAMHTAPTVSIVNAGEGGSTVNNWSPTLTSPLNLFHAAAGVISREVGLKIALIQLGTNTSLGEIDNYRGMVTRLQEIGFSVLILVPGGTTIAPGDRVDLKRALYDIAVEKDVPLIDFTDLIGALDAADRGYMDDTLHENAAGYRYEASTILGALRG